MSYTIFDILFILGDSCTNSTYEEQTKRDVDERNNPIDRTTQLLICIALALMKQVIDENNSDGSH